MCYLQNHHSTHFNHNIIWSILIGCIDPLYWSGELIHCFDRVHWSMLIHCFDRVHRPMFFWSSALICDAEIEWKHYQSINQSINQSTNFQVSHSLFIVVIYWHDGFCLAKNVVHIHIDINIVTHIVYIYSGPRFLYLHWCGKTNKYTSLILCELMVIN